MTNSKKLMVLLILLTLLSMLFVGCNQSTAVDGNGTVGGNDTVTDSEVVTTEAKLDIPTNVNMNGKEFTVMSANWHGNVGFNVVDIFPETESADPVISEAYYRAIKVQDQLKCTIVFYESPTLDGFQKELQDDVMINLVHDVLLIRGDYLLSSILSKYLADMDKMEHTNYTAPWWDNGSSESLRVGGKLFFVLGDFSMNPMRAINMTVYNKDLMETLQMEKMNKIVTNGQWTVSKMLEMAKKGANDVDKSGTLDPGETVGVAYFADSISPLVQSAGVRFVEIDEEGVPYMVVDQKKYMDRLQNVMEAYMDWRYMAETLRQNPDVHGRWREGETLFYIAPVAEAEDIRDCEFNLGIAPLPKYSEEEEYRGSMCSGYCSFVAVPYTNGDYENTGIFLELMAYEGYKEMRPEFYENMLLRKVARDDESAEMLKFIFTNISLDPGEVYNFGRLNGPIWKNVAYPNDYPLNLASDYASCVPNVDMDIEALMDVLRTYEAES